MVQCSECGGFCVEGACPNCAAARPSERGGRWVRAVVCLALVGGGAMTLSACYGAPCEPGDGCGVPADVPAATPDRPADAADSSR